MSPWHVTVALRGAAVASDAHRARAKDELRARARRLRADGWTYQCIREELGVSTSSLSLWLRDMPRPAVDRAARTAHINRVYWEPQRRVAEQAREAVKAAAAAEAGDLSDRELLVGTALYWAEGAKSKPYRRSEMVSFINSDSRLIRVFCRWLDLVEVAEDRRRYRLHIHETADPVAAHEYWRGLVGMRLESFYAPNIKRHKPRTRRHNTGAEYRGCLPIILLRGADLYRRIEGWWRGIADDVDRATSAGHPLESGQARRDLSRHGDPGSSSGRTTHFG